MRSHRHLFQDPAERIAEAGRNAELARALARRQLGGDDLALFEKATDRMLQLAGGLDERIASSAARSLGGVVRRLKDPGAAARRADPEVDRLFCRLERLEQAAEAQTPAE